MAAASELLAAQSAYGRPRVGARSARGAGREYPARGAVCLLCLAGVFASTWFSFRFGHDLAAAGFLYLVFVVLAAVYGGFWQATLLSVVSVACLDYFFTVPFFSFRVDRFADCVEIGAFEFTALVVSRLSNRAQARALEAAVERRDTARLYETARRILLIDTYRETGDRIAILLKRDFDLRRVLVFDADSAGMYESGNWTTEAEHRGFVEQTRNAYFSDSDTFDPAQKAWFCVLRLGSRPVGALGLCGTDMGEINARALASLAAIALERARALDRQSHAEAEREAEKLRTAVLDALAHKFKTPLTVIRTAVAGLPAAGELSPPQTEMVSLIDQEASLLNDLANLLLEAQDLNSADFEPRPEPLLLSHLIGTAVAELEHRSDRERFRFHIPEHEPLVPADRELMVTALSQLVDNALKYSVAASVIDVAVIVRESGVVLTVRSKGLVLAEEHRERIFDRFYRAPGAQRCASGTGLGLSIVRTIAADHHGHVWAEGEPDYGTTFSLSLPIGQKAVA